MWFIYLFNFNGGEKNNQIPCLEELDLQLPESVGDVETWTVMDELLMTKFKSI